MNVEADSSFELLEYTSWWNTVCCTLAPSVSSKVGEQSLMCAMPEDDSNVDSHSINPKQPCRHKHELALPASSTAVMLNAAHAVGDHCICVFDNRNKSTAALQGRATRATAVGRSPSCYS